MNSDVREEELEIDTRKENLSSRKEGSAMTSNRERKTIIDLHKELLVKIIDMVPITQWASLEFVSRSFQDVVHRLWGQLREIRLDELTYNEEKKKADPYQIVESVLEKFLIRAPHIYLISGFDEFFDQRTPIRLETIQLLSKFEHLQTIEFSDQDIITAEVFAVFLESSASRQSWKSLDISGVIFENKNNHNAVGIMENQPALNLECFKFSTRTTGMFDGFLQVDWSGLKKLVVVERFDSANELLSIIRQCTQLVHLEIEIPECGNENGQPSYIDFMQCLADLERISILKISCCQLCDIAFHNALLMLIQDLGRRHIITDFSLLAFSCTDGIVGAIIDHLPRLKSLELDVRECKKPSLERLANIMCQLETLKFLSYWDAVDGTVFQAICGNMSNLKCLDFYHPTASSADLEILGDLRMLKELHIWGRKLESGTVETWTRLGFGSCLVTLELMLQDDISPEAARGFFKIMTRLRWLELRGATDDILQAIVESCPKLVVLQLGYSPNVTSTGIQFVIDNCSQLNILKVDCHSEWFPATLTVGKYRKITFKPKVDE